MSRPVAGVRGKTVVLAIPGSPKGAKENLEAVLKLLPHACVQAAGQDSRKLHVGGVKKLEKDAGIAVVAADKASAEAAPDPDNLSVTCHHHQHDHGHGHAIPKAHSTTEEKTVRSIDPTLGASRRHRTSPYPMLPVMDAVAAVIDNSPLTLAEDRSVSSKLVGHVTAADIRAVEEVPSYRASIVDGYAVRIPNENDRNQEKHSIKGAFPVLSVSHAEGSNEPPPLADGTVARITTGAPLPANANAVVMVEDTTIVRTTADGSEEEVVEVLTDAIKPGENIRQPGSDIKLGTVILPKGTVISSLGGEVGLLTASGIRSVPVFRKPRVGVLSTGDEVTDITETGPLRSGQVRDSNRPSLIHMLEGWRLCSRVFDLGIARDTPQDSLETALRTGFSVHDLDVIVGTGGVSMGELDLLKPTIEHAMGGTVHFGRVSMKPGKPTTFGSVTVKGSPTASNCGTNPAPEPTNPNAAAITASAAGGGRNRRRLIFGLPGNPASAIVTANLFVLPALQKMSGRGVADQDRIWAEQKEEAQRRGNEDKSTKAATPTSSQNSNSSLGLPRILVKLSHPIHCDPARVEYHRVTIRASNKDDGGGLLYATSTGFQRSSRVGSVAGANGLLVLPQKEGVVEEGDMCEALIFGDIVGF